MGLLQKMTTCDTLSPVEKEIVAYMFENSDRIIGMQIAELALQTCSSNASIIRVCRKLGLSGYKEFKLLFAQELEKHRQKQEYVDFNYPFHMHESVNQVCANIARLTKSTIDACYQELDTREFEDIAKSIAQSRQVYMYAIGDSLIRAKSFENKLLKIGKYLITTTDLSENSVYSGYAKEEDCAIFVSYSANNKEFVRSAQILKQRGTKIVTITANPKSVLAKLSTNVIVIPDLEDNLNSIATFYSQISIEYVLNVLYSLIYTLHYQENHRKKTRIDQIRLKVIE